MNIKDMPHVTVEQVLAMRKAAMKLAADNAALVEALEAVAIITNMGSVASMKDVNGIAKSALDKAKGDV